MVADQSPGYVAPGSAFAEQGTRQKNQLTPNKSNSNCQIAS
jgi:hypothetical protein